MIKSSKNQILQTVKKLSQGGYSDEETLNKDIDFVLDNVPDPNVIEYIFNLKYKLTPEEIVEKALSYKPLITPLPSK